MKQSLSIKTGGTFKGYQHGDGQDYEVIGLSHIADGTIVYVIGYAGKDLDVIIMDSMLGVTVTGGAFTFTQDDLYSVLNSNYREGSLVKDGLYPLLIISTHGDLTKIVPAPPPAPQLKLAIVKSNILPIAGGIPTVSGDESIPTVEGDPLPTVEG